MCKTHALKYSCKHVHPIRLRACHATFALPPRPGRPPKPACSSPPSLVLRSSQACGDCQREEAELLLRARRDDARSSPRLGLGSSVAEAEYAAMCYRLSQTFPPYPRPRGNARPGRARGKGRTRGTLLTREVRAEEVVERWVPRQTVVGGVWDQATWGEGYKRLDDELAEEEAEREEELPTTGLMGESLEEYLSAFEAGETEDGEQRLGNSDSLSADWSWTLVESEEGTSGEAVCWTPDLEAAWQATTATTEPATPSKSPQAVREPSDENCQTAATADVEPTSQHPPGGSASSCTLPERKKRPSLRRQSTFDRGKDESEVREHIEWLPRLVTVSSN